MIWFALAAAAILPVALDGLLTRADVVAPRLNRDHLARRARRPRRRALAFARPPRLVVRLGVARARRSQAVRAATRDPNVRVWATDGTADWLLWRIPDLRGRLAYDVRFELYDAQALERIVDYGRGRRLARSRPRVRRRGGGRPRASASAPARAGNRVVYGDKTIFVLSRPG